MSHDYENFTTEYKSIKENLCKAYNSAPNNVKQRRAKVGEISYAMMDMVIVELYVTDNKTPHEIACIVNATDNPSSVEVNRIKYRVRKLRQNADTKASVKKFRTPIEVRQGRVAQCVNLMNLYPTEYRQAQLKRAYEELAEAQIKVATHG